MLNNGCIKHSSVSIKLIVTNRKKIVSTCYVIPTGNRFVTTVDIVVITTLINETCLSGNTILKISSNVVAYKDAIMIGYIFTDKNTFGCKLV